MPVGAYPGPQVSIANGVTTVFPYNFRILESDDLRVTLDGVTTTSGFTVDGVGEASGGNVTFSVAPGNGIEVLRERAAEYLRADDYQRSGDFSEEQVDKDFDRVVMLTQQLKALTDRSLKLEAGSGLAGDTFVFPSPGAGMGFRWNAAGLAIELVSLDDIGTTFLQSGADMESRTWTAKVGERLSLKDAGALSDGTSQALKIQAAVDEAISSKRALYVPGAADAYATASNISITDAITLYGDGKVQSHLKALTGCESLLRPSNSTANTRSQFRDLLLNGNSIARRCIYAPYMVHTRFDNIQASGCIAGVATDAAIVLGGQSVGTGGWNNDFYSVEVSYTQGNGIALAGVNNCNTFIGGKFFAIDKIGVVAASSETLGFYGTTFEVCKEAAFIAQAGVNNLTFNTCYLLANGQDGHAYTGLTVKADIHLNGSDLSTISAASPCIGIDVINCTNNQSAASDCFIFAPGADYLFVDRCQLNPQSPNKNVLPVVALYWGPATNRAAHIHIGKNRGFGPPITFLGPVGTPPALEFDASGIVIDTVRPRNFAVEDMNKWGNVGGGSASTFERHPDSTDGDLTYRLTTTATGTSSIFGFRRQAEDFPDNIGKFFQFSMDVAISAVGNLGANLVCGLGVQNSADDESIERTAKGGIFLWPEEGELVFGAVKHGSASAGFCTYANPILCEVGADQAMLRSRLTKGRKEFIGGAAPTTGTWVADDHIGKSGIAAAGVPGYFCTASGTFSAATDNTGDTDGATAVITGMTDTSDFYVGEYVSCSAGFATTGPFKILSKTSTTMTLDTASNSAQSNITVSTPDPVFKAEGAVAA